MREPRLMEMLLVYCCEQLAIHFIPYIRGELFTLRLVNHQLCLKVSEHCFRATRLVQSALNSPETILTCVTTFNKYQSFIHELSCQFDQPWTTAQFQAVRRILEQLPKLTTLCIQYPPGVDMDAMGEWLRCCQPLLTTLITYCSRPHRLGNGNQARRLGLPPPDTYDRFTQLIPLEGILHLHNLHRLVLLRAHGLNDTVYQALLEASPYLNQVTFYDTHITDRTLHELVTHPARSQRLCALEAIIAPYITDQGLTAIVKDNPNLERLRVEECGLVTGQFLSHMFPKRLTQLRALQLGGESFSGQMRFRPQYLDQVFQQSWLKLRQVALTALAVTDHTIDALTQNCHNLTRVQLTSCNAITPNGYALVLRRLSRLRMAYLCPDESVQLTTAFLRGPSVCHGLTGMVLYAVEANPDDFSDKVDTWSQLTMLSLPLVPKSEPLERTLGATFPNSSVKFAPFAS
ncbi:hypothetical protein IWQ61_008160 [Dispira simplex]|nr:hypothetical protein IWQ61_008160 [Dispira simplex]